MMDLSQKKIEEFEETLREIKNAVTQESELFRTPDIRKTMCGLSYGFSISIAALCIAGARIRSSSGASQNAMAFLIGAFVLMIIAGGILKLALFSRIMAKRNRTLSSLLKIVYGSSAISVIAGACISTLGSAFFFFQQGSGTLLVPFSALFMSFVVFSLAARIRLPEFLVLGWAMLILGFLALFFIGQHPWLWSAIVWSGSFLALAVAGSLFKSAS